MASQKQIVHNLPFVKSIASVNCDQQSQDFSDALHGNDRVYYLLWLQIGGKNKSKKVIE
jgi:hypothetical protein